MKTDLYTKVILTIIAVALTANVIKSFFVTPVQAADAGNARAITLPVNADGTVDVNIKSINTSTVAFFNATPIPVVVKNK